MKFSLSWLKNWLDTDADLDLIVERLTIVGLEVEEVENRAAELSAFVVAEVLSADPHPNADKLQVCRVNNGSETFQVVCGAPNARAGMKGVFAPTGSYIAGIDMTLKPANIRGEDSNGMLCSEREMGLSEEHDGIIELPDDAVVGQPFAAVMGLDDPVIEIAITPNRQDCLGVYGIARDLAASGLGTLKSPDSATIAGTFPSPVTVTLDFPEDENSACPHFTARVIRNVKNGPSPAWLQQRLLSIGLRPISLLVDITNFMTFDQGRPLHVFDADKVKGDLVVRLSKNGESFAALDGETYETDDAMTVICDDSGVLSLAGIIGGESTSCSEETTTVILESAWFDPIRTATTGRKLAIESDARYRFERGVDPATTEPGMEEATRLIMELCADGDMTPEAGEVFIAGTAPVSDKVVTLRPARVRQLGGIDLPTGECQRILQALGFEVSQQGDKLAAKVPSWRRDIDGEADLVEEIIRIHGYGNIPSVPLSRPDGFAHANLTAMQIKVRTAKRLLASRGMIEAVTWSFLPQSHAEIFGGGAPQTMLANPISSELTTMRPSMLPNLLAAAGRNQDRGISDAGLFEVGAQFSGDRPEDQTTAVGGIRFGNMAADRHWTLPPRQADAFDAKADAFATLIQCGAPAGLQVAAESAPDWYHPGRSGVFRLGPKNVLAAFGEIHPGILRRMDVKGPVVGFEVFLNNIPEAKAGKSRSRPSLLTSDFQAVERDFAFIVAKDVAANDLVRAAQSADKKLIADVQVFDLFEGAGIEEGHKSLAFTIRLVPTDRTLTDDEIDAVSDRVIAAVTKATGGRLRG